MPVLVITSPKRLRSAAMAAANSPGVSVKGTAPNFEILSQIMPRFTIQTKTKLYGEGKQGPEESPGVINVTASGIYVNYKGATHASSKP
jgi:hypothetical protein